MANYYIHGKIGDDSAAGTGVTVPLKTLDFALGIYAEGDTLWLKGGYEYTVDAPFQMTKSITIKAWENDRPSSEPIITWSDLGANCFAIIPGSSHGTSYVFKNIIFKKHNGSGISSIYILPSNRVISVTIHACIFTGNIDTKFDSSPDLRYGVHRPDTDAVGITSTVTIEYCAFIGLSKGYWGYEKSKDYNILKNNIFSACGNQAKDEEAAVSVYRSAHASVNTVVALLQRNYFHDCEEPAIYKTWLTYPTALAYYGSWRDNNNMSNYNPIIMHEARLYNYLWNSVAVSENGWTIPAGWVGDFTGSNEELTLTSSDDILYQDFNDLLETSMLYVMKDQYKYRIGAAVITPPDVGYLEIILADNPNGTNGEVLIQIDSSFTHQTIVPALSGSQLGKHIVKDYTKKPTHRYLIFKPSQPMSCVLSNLSIWETINYPYPFRNVEALDFRWPLRSDEAADGIAYSDPMNIGPYGLSAELADKSLDGVEYTLNMVDSLVQPFRHRQLAGYDVDWDDEYTSWEDLINTMNLSGGAWFNKIKYSLFDAFDVGIDEDSYYFVLWDDTDTDHSYTDASNKNTILQLDSVSNVVNYNTYAKAYVVSYGKIPGWYNLSGKNNSENKYGGQSKKMTAGLHDITIEQGSNFKRTFTWKDSNAAPVNVTGYTAKLNIKGKKSDTTALYSTDQAGHIVLGGSAGTITINVPAATTDALDFNWGVWDIELTDTNTPGQVTRLLEGKVKLNKQVTTV